jgi:hypothetical protein
MVDVLNFHFQVPTVQPHATAFGSDSWLFSIEHQWVPQRPSPGWKISLNCGTLASNCISRYCIQLHPIAESQGQWHGIVQTKRDTDAHSLHVRYALRSQCIPTVQHWLAGCAFVAPRLVPDQRLLVDGWRRAACVCHHSPVAFPSPGSLCCCAPRADHARPRHHHCCPPQRQAQTRLEHRHFILAAAASPATAR